MIIVHLIRRGIRGQRINQGIRNVLKVLQNSLMLVGMKNDWG